MRMLFTFCLLLCSLVGCKPKVTSVREPASFGASGSIPRYWSNLPLTIYVANDFDQDFPSLANDQLNPFEEMMLAWDNQVNVNLFRLEPSSSFRSTNLEYSSLASYHDNEMGIYRIDQWFPDVTKDALAIAQYFFIRTNVGTASEFNQIYHADILINYETHQFYLDHTAQKFGKYDLQTVVLHELGHVVGINHLSGSAVMNAFLSTNEQKRSPLTNDINAIRALYQPSAPAFILSGMTDQGPRDPHPDEGQKGRGVIELLKSGECRHYEDGKLVHSHHVPVNSLK